VLDEIIGAINKVLEMQKILRSNFIKKFNSFGIGEVYRIRDVFDSSKYIYKLKFNDLNYDNALLHPLATSNNLKSVFEVLWNICRRLFQLSTG
jgi:CRISPR/Cas system-associated endonuclease Cas3-HD